MITDQIDVYMESLANTWCCASADLLNGHDPLPGKGHQVVDGFFKSTELIEFMINRSTP